MIKNVIFDFGNVITRYQPRELVACFAETPEDVEPLFSAIYHDWKALDLGNKEYPAYIQETLAMLPERLHAPAREFFAHWQEKMPYIPGIEKLLQDLVAAGYRLYVLSNAPVYFAELVPSFSVAQYFTDVLISGMTHDEKPHLSIYRTALARFGIRAEESLFLDDRPENTEAARVCGIHAITFDGNTEALIQNEFPTYGICLKP